MSVNSVAIRLGTDGKGQVKADFSEIADSGDASAKRIVTSYEKASDDVSKALERQNRAAANVAAIMPSPVQSTINQSNGTGFDGRQNANAAQYAALLAEEERQAAAVRAAIDPLYAAQKRYDDEVRISSELLARGKISEVEHAAAVRLSGSALAEAKRLTEEHAGAMSLNRGQIITAQSAVLRFADAVMAGQNPLRAFALEAHKGAEVLSMDEGGMSGGLAKVTALFSPMNIAIASGALAAAAAGEAWYSYDAAMNKLAATAQGTGAKLGESAGQLEANAEAASAASRLTIGAAREIEVAYTGIARSGDVLVGLTAITQDYAAATGQDLKTAQSDLVKTFGDSSRGAEELATKYGFLTQAQVEQITKLQEAGEYEKAQTALLNDLGRVVAGAAEHLSGMALAWDNVKRAASGASNAVGGFMERYGSSILGGLTLGATDSFFTQPSNKLQKPGQPINARANASAAAAMDVANVSTGFGAKDELQKHLAAINAGLAADQSGQTKLTAEQLDRLRVAQDQYTNALKTYLAPAEQHVAIRKAQAEMAHATTKAEKDLAGQHLEEAQNAGKLATSSERAADAMYRGERAADRFKGTSDKHAESLAREAAAMEANTQGALDAAEAYLKGSAAGAEADARRQATTDATKKGISVEEQVRRQLALTIAQGAEAGAKSTATLNDETAARRSVNAAIASGKVSIDQMGHALSDEAALRVLTTLKAQAQGKELETLTRVINDYRKALSAAHAEEATSGAATATDAANRRIEAARLAARFAGAPAGQLQRAKSASDAADEANKGNFQGEARTTFLAKRSTATDTELSTQRATSQAEQLRAQRDGLAVTQLEIGLVGKSTEEHDRLVGRMQLEQQLAVQYGDEVAKYAPAILKAADASREATDRQKDLAASWAEVKNAGTTFVDDVLNPQNWTSFSNLGRKVLTDLANEALKLAAINPLKNWLFNENNPTLAGGSGGGIFGAIRSLLGGGGGDDSGVEHAANDVGSTAGYASGTEYSAGGLAWVGENGRELINLPQGSRVTNAADTRRMLSAANDSAQVVVKIQANDYFDAKVAGISGSTVNAAAPSIAAGGASIAARNSADVQRRSLVGG